MATDRTLEAGDPVRGVAAWGRLLLGLVLVYALFMGLGDGLGSDRGQHGIAIALAVVGALFVVERLLSGQPFRLVPRALGLGLPAARGMIAAAAVAGALLLVLPLVAAATSGRLALRPDWALLLPGLFAQAGIAEETLFRGYLFGHLRRGRSFRRAATLSLFPFVGVHLVLFATMPPAVALAAVALAALVSFPLAQLYELGGRTMWAPALLHFVIQGALKVISVEGTSGAVVPVVWMAACALLPYAAFAVRRAPDAPV